MDLPTLMDKAARTAIEVVGKVEDEQLELLTPCQNWNVRTLANHLVFWAAFRSEVAARKQTPPPERESDVDLITGDWVGTFEHQVHRAVAAWGEPGALEGMTAVAGGQTPAPVIAQMLVGELVVHGWDLAKATGQELTVDPEVADATHATVVLFAEMGLEAQIFGDPVAVPDSAPVLDKALALSGRDPYWTP